MIQNDCEIPARRPIETAGVYLVIADISGYTQYLRKHGADISHAEQAVGELLESIISASRHPLIVYELSGDAVSLYAMNSAENNVANDIVHQVQNLFRAFQDRMNELQSCPTYTGCHACQKAGDLRLKVILHYGRVVMTEVGGFKKIAGTSVIFAHRLLKNSIEWDEYLLVTQSFYDQCTDIELNRAIWTSENVEGFGEQAVLVEFPKEMPFWARPENRNSCSSMDNLF